jgi:4-hydroxybenzoate polyprenyltransferase
MTALLFATLDEARPLLDLLNASRIAEHPFETYAFPAAAHGAPGFVVISGMGPQNAAAATRYVICDRGAGLLINAGVCGTLSPGFKPGDVFRVTEVTHGDAGRGEGDPSRLPVPAEEAWSFLPPARLVSFREPVFGGERRAALEKVADLVEMEGYAVARTCRELKVRCQLIKGVTDLANSSGREELHRNLARVSAAVAELVLKGLTCRPARQSMAARIANFVKIEHTIFSLPLLFAGAWLGAGGRWPGLRLLGLIALAGLGARTLGMAMNRILDRRFDQMNPRTAGRELPAGRLTPAQAWSVAGAGLASYLLACALLGPACLRLSPIPAVVLITYSLLKRFTIFCHLGIGVCLGLGPLGAWVAVTGSATAGEPIILLSLFTFCWISGFDIIYALQDIESDRRTGVHSMPAALGSVCAQIIAALLHLVAMAAIARLWWLTGGGVFSGVALAISVAAFGLAYFQRVPLHVRFFPISAIAGIAGALIPLLGGVR